MKIEIEKNNWTVKIYEDIRTLSPADIREVGKLVASNMVVVFPEPIENLSPEDQLTIADEIGEIQVSDNPTRAKNIVLIPGVVRVTGKKNENGEPGLFGHTSALDWHADQASNKNRMPIVWMYGAEGMAGSRTSFINMIEVYNGLPQTLKDRIQNKKCYFGYKAGKYSTSPYFKEHVIKENLFNLVMTTSAGVTGLYFPFNQVFGMNNTSDQEFQELKDELVDHILKPQYAYHHDWIDGQIVLSDQWLSIHKRWEFENMEQRLLYRIALTYDKVFESYP